MSKYWFALVVLAGWWGCGTTTAAFRAGVAVRNVTPDPLLPVCSGIGPSKPAALKQGELTVRAPALENHGTRNLLLGLTSDSFGYLLTAVDWGSFKRYAYISRTSLGEQAGDLFIAAALRLIAEEPAPGAL